MRMKLKYFILFFSSFISFNCFCASVVLDGDVDSVLSRVLARSCSGFLDDLVRKMDMTTREGFLAGYRVVWEEDLNSICSLRGQIDGEVERQMRGVIDALFLSAAQIGRVVLVGKEVNKLTSRSIRILRTNLDQFFCKKTKLVVQEVPFPGVVDDGPSCKIIWKTGLQIFFEDREFKKTTTTVNEIVSAFGWFELYDIGGWPG